MKKTRESDKPVSADAIARLADQGKDASHFFKGQGRMEKRGPHRTFLPFSLPPKKRIFYERIRTHTGAGRHRIDHQ
jgi:hypothetical protein